MENCTKFGQLILSKIIKIVATSCQILRLKCTKFDFDWGSASDPAGGAHSAPPDTIAGFNGGQLLRGGEGGTWEGKRKGKGRGKGTGERAGGGEEGGGLWEGGEREGRERRRERKGGRPEPPHTFSSGAGAVRTLAL